MDELILFTIGDVIRNIEKEMRTNKIRESNKIYFRKEGRTINRTG